jgi:sulfite exporter TauE/SafE
MNYGGVFMFGLLVGLAPCAPLLALLFDVVLISKGALDGMLYAFSFGFGTFVSGLITISIIAGILTRLPATLIKSEKLNVVFKVVCALLLAILGIALILKGYNRF